MTIHPNLDNMSLLLARIQTMYTNKKTKNKVRIKTNNKERKNK